MSRLPIPGSDDGSWGAILNDFLNVAHNADGSLQNTSVTKTMLETAVQTSLNKADTALQIAPVTSVNGQTGAVTVSAGGTVSDANASTKGVVQLAGDLSGTAALPRIASGVITNVNIGSSAAIDQTKINGLATSFAAKQDSNTNLTTIAGLAPANDDVLQRKAGAWTNRTPAQLKTDLSLDNVSNTSDTTKNTASASLTNKTITDVTNNVAANSIKTTTSGSPVGVVAAIPAADQVLVATSTSSAAWQYPVYEQANVVAATGSTETLVLPSVATIHDLTIDANCTVTLPSGFGSKSTSILVIIRQQASGGTYTRTVTWAGTPSITWLDTGTAPTIASGASAATAISFLTTDGGNTWLGTTSATNSSSGVVALTDASVISTDASLGSLFTVTLGGNRTIDAPTNPLNGKRLRYRITQDGSGSRTVTWNGAFRYGTDIPTPTLSTAAGKTDYVEFIYNASASKWDCVAVNRGY